MKIEEALKIFKDFGDDVEGALEVVCNYKKDFPEDLENAIGTLAKQAALHISESED